IYHIFGFNTNMMLAMRMGGANILIANPRDLPSVFKELKGETFHSFPAVNTLFNAMAHHPEFNSVDWSGLVISVGGGMAVTSATAKLWLEKTGCPIVEGYGLSETSPSATCNPGLGEAAVRAYCEANRTGSKRPKVVEFRTELPKTNVGKSLRRELRDKG